MNHYFNCQKKIFFKYLLIFSAIFVVIYLWWVIFVPKNPGFTETKVFLVQKGEGTKEISLNLKKQSLIKNVLLFRIYAINTALANKLQAGEYLLSPSMAISQIVGKMAKGDVITEKITIIEGWNLRDIGWNLENRGLYQAEELFELIGFPLIDYSTKSGEMSLPQDFSSEFAFLQDKPKNVGLEGYLFPDTYYLRKQEISNSRQLQDLVTDILNNFDKKLTADLKEEVKRQGKTIFEIITMASMIEKEVSKYEDREIVSGILWKRLKADMPLQVDATLNYIIPMVESSRILDEIRTGKKTVEISLADTKIDSPYNTYKYEGLPLGPISNPGLESIKAAIYPKDSDYWYYLSTPEGETIFSKTLEEHNRAKAKYLK